MRAGLPQLLVVLAIVLLFFGARRLPDLAGSLGRSLKEFRKAADDEDPDRPPNDPPGEQSTDRSGEQGA